MSRSARAYGFADLIEAVGLDEAVADRSSVGGDQRERHGAPDQQGVHPVTRR